MQLVHAMQPSGGGARAQLGLIPRASFTCGFYLTALSNVYVALGFNQSSLSSQYILGPAGQGLLPLLPCVHLQKACCATLRPGSPQGKSKIETGPYWTRAVSDSGRVLGVKTHCPKDSEQEVTAEARAL